MVNDQGKIVADFTPSDDGEIVQETSERLRLKGKASRTFFDQAWPGRILLRAEFKVFPNALAYLGIGRHGIDKLVSSEYRGPVVRIASWGKKGVVLTEGLAPESEAPDRQLVVLIAADHMAVYLDGEFCGTYRGWLPENAPFIGANGDGAFRNVEIATVPE